MKQLTKRLTKRLTTKEKNAAFAKLPRAQKRVEIAKDVIKQLNAKNITAKTGVYFDLHLHESKDTHIGLDMQSLLKPSKVEDCHACALGAIFYSKVKKMNKFTISGSESSSYGVGLRRCDIATNLYLIFTEKQLRLIESAFEKYGENFEFWEQYEEENSRLKAIMKNIIKNNGTFKP